MELPANMWLTDLTAAQAGRVWFERFRPAYQTGAVPEETQQLAMRFALQLEFLEAAIERLGQAGTPGVFELRRRVGQNRLRAFASVGSGEQLLQSSDSARRTVQASPPVAGHRPPSFAPRCHRHGGPTVRAWLTVIVSLSVALLADWYLNRQATSIRIALDDDGHTEEFLMWEQD